MIAPGIMNGRYGMIPSIRATPVFAIDGSSLSPGIVAPAKFAVSVNVPIAGMDPVIR